MHVMQSLSVFGERVDVLVTTASSHGSFCMLVQTSPPGGGPPPHVHQNEDEVFLVLEGEYEVFDGTAWTRLPAGEPAHRLRGQPHTFRNCGRTEGRILVVVTPGGLDEYFHRLAPLQVPQDMDEVVRVSAEYGIRFLSDDPPVEPPL